jgi:hypothetical protein
MPDLRKEINWTSIMIEAVVQVIILGALMVGYVITNERWKGGVDATIQNLVVANQLQLEVNVKLQTAVEKLSDSVNILTTNQQKVLTLLEYHMKETQK